jgi:hypothetical protein
MIIANTRNRIHAISIDGNVADKYFAVTSEQPRKIVEAKISAMPRNGRSARAGADGAANFFFGNGNETLSSLAAVAEGGGTAKLRRKAKWNQGEPLKTIIRAHGQGRKTGCRYARLRATGRHIFSVIPGRRQRIRAPRGPTTNPESRGRTRLLDSGFAPEEGRAPE